MEIDPRKRKATSRTEARANTEGAAEDDGLEDADPGAEGEGVGCGNLAQAARGCTSGTAGLRGCGK